MMMRRKLKAAAAVKEFASALEKDSWCIDLSGSRPAALHALSDRTACFETFDFKFKEWTERTGTEVTGMGQEDWRGLAHRVAGLLPHTFGSTFRPEPKRFIAVNGICMVNKYVPFRPDFRDDPDGRVWVDELLARLFPDPSESATVLRFLAHVVQKPMERPQWGLLITGDSGTGKSLLIELAEKALNNRHRWRENSYKPIGTQFSEVLPDNLLVTFDDAVAPGNTYENLKFAMTRSVQEVEIKGQQKKTVREVYARIIVLSNAERPLELEDDRRFFVPQRCTHVVDREESGKFFEGFCAWLNQTHTADFLFHYFNQVDLNGFDPSKTIRTKTLLKMEGKDDGVQVDELVGEVAERLQIFHEIEVSEYVRRRGVDASPELVCKALKKAGFARRRRSNPCGNGQLELWCSVRSRRSRSLTDDEKRRIGEALSRRR